MTSNTKKSIQKTVNKVRETASQEYQDNIPVLRITTLQVLRKHFLRISLQSMNFM